MSSLSQGAPAESIKPTQPVTPPSENFIHRVCIQCNNVFRVPADKFDAKQCPNCHKG
jgi:hypothetical protein